MSTISDQARDINGQELHRILSLYPLPDFVKSASQQDICGDDSLPPHLYADITRRCYPIHSGPATIISSIFFNEKKASMNKHRAALIESNLARAAEYFKVGGYMRRLTEKVASAATHEATQLPDAAFAIVFEGADGAAERHYPMRNVHEVKAAAAWLADHRDLLPFSDRHQIANKVLEKSAEFGAGLPEHRNMLEKMAGLGVCAGKDAARLIRTRMLAAGGMHKPSALQQELEKLAALCEEKPDSVRHYVPLIKIAEIVDQFDHEHGLNRKYDDILERPEDVLFAVTGKTAAELEEGIIGNVLTGNYYKKADLQSLPVRDLADNLGEDFAQVVSTAGAWVDTEKLARIVPTLPLGDAELFDEVVAAAGVRPFATKSASAGRSISPALQLEIAEQHKPAPGSLWDRVERN